VVVVVDAALVEAQERAQRVRRLEVELQLPRRMVRLLREPVVVDAAVADVVVREAALLLLNLLHDLPMEP
jgi:hypothetical protein